MNRVIAILPKIQGKKGILHMESVATESNTFEEELEQEEVTAENWNGGYDEDGNYTGDGEYDEDGNYVGAKPKTALEEAIENWNGGYDEEGDYTGAGEYDESGNYVGPKPTQESLDAASDESGDGSGDESFADDQSSETSEDGEVIHHMTTETQMIQMDMVIIQKITVIIRGMILRDIDSIWKL